MGACASRRAYDEAMTDDAMRRPSYGSDRVLTAMATASPEERQALISRWRQLWPHWLRHVEGEIQAAEQEKDDGLALTLAGDALVWAASAMAAGLPVEDAPLEALADRTVERIALRHYESAAAAEQSGRWLDAAEGYRLSHFIQPGFRDTAARYRRLAQSYLPRAIVAWQVLQSTNPWDNAQGKLAAMFAAKLQVQPLPDITTVPTNELAAAARQVFAIMQAPADKAGRASYGPRVYYEAAKRCQANVIVLASLDDGAFDVAPDRYEGQMIRRDIRCRIKGSLGLIDTRSGRTVHEVEHTVDATASVRFRWDDTKERERDHPEAFERARTEALQSLVGKLHRGWLGSWSSSQRQAIAQYVRLPNGQAGNRR
jgi:hypothetical protein